jgi:hydrogenase/urease accessory protein HupE
MTDQATDATAGQKVAPAARPLRRQPRPSTIVWGAILMAAALLGLRLGASGVPLSNLSVLWSVVVVGAVLVFAALLAALVRLVRR